MDITVQVEMIEDDDTIPVMQSLYVTCMQGGVVTDMTAASDVVFVLTPPIGNSVDIPGGTSSVGQLSLPPATWLPGEWKVSCKFAFQGKRYHTTTASFMP